MFPVKLQGQLFDIIVLTCLLTIYHVKIFKKKIAEALKPTQKKSSPRNHIHEAFRYHEKRKQLQFEVYKMAI